MAALQHGSEDGWRAAAAAAAAAAVELKLILPTMPAKPPACAAGSRRPAAAQAPLRQEAAKAPASARPPARFANTEEKEK